MSDSETPHPPAKGQFLLYSAADGRTKIEVQLENETVWLTQQHMEALFQTTKQNISLHLLNIFKEGELAEDSVVKESLTTARDGKGYRTKFYNLDAIICVGYRVKSAVATRFRIWATQQLREFIVKGFVLDDERLKNPDQPFDYFEELLRRIQDIRTSERRFYQKITDRGNSPKQNTRSSIASRFNKPTKLGATLTWPSSNCRRSPSQRRRVKRVGWAESSKPKTPS
jgi:hypothetical protein